MVISDIPQLYVWTYELPAALFSNASPSAVFPRTTVALLLLTTIPTASNVCNQVHCALTDANALPSTDAAHRRVRRGAPT